MTVWNVYTEVGTGWLALPIHEIGSGPDPVDPLEAALFAGTDREADPYGARASAREIVAMLPQPADPDRLAAQLTEFIRRANDVGAVTAAVLLGGSGTDVLGYLEVLVDHARPGGLPTDLDELEQAIWPRGATWAETGRLPIADGGAVRLHMIDAETQVDPGTHSDAGKVVVESVWVFAPFGDGSAVAKAGVSWSDLAASELMVEVADAVLATLRLERA